MKINSEIPIHKILIKFKNYSPQVSETVQNILRQIKEKENIEFGIWDFITWGSERNSGSVIIDFIFNILTIIVMFMCFFGLTSTMTGNILNNTREIAVMRSIGVTKKQIVKVYVYEAFVLVFSSCIFGIIIGSIVSWTMIMQVVLFTALPIPFKFPWTNLVTSFFVSLICAYLSTYTPAKTIVKDQIAMIMRKVD